MRERLRLFARFVFGRLLPRRPYPVVTGPLKGCKFILGSLAGEGGGASVYFGLMEPGQSTIVVEKLHRGGRFFDIGANVGYYTLLASRVTGEKGEVVAVEPLPRNLGMLRQHVNINHLKNVEVVPAAVSESVGKKFFSEGDSTATGRLDTRGHIEVDTITLDELTARFGEPDMIKIDVEGAEERVLAGAERTFIRKPPILLSTHSDALRASCLDGLKSRGYVCVPIEGGSTYEFYCE